jgi:hypothetical protein
VHDPLSQDRDRAAGRRRPHPRRVRVAESDYQRIDKDTGKPVTGKYEFTYRDASGRQIWQTANGDTKADAKAERAALVARMHNGGRVEHTGLTVSDVAKLWLERGTGRTGRWAPPTRERYERMVRRHIDASADPSRRPLGALKLRDLTVDRVAEWSLANERELAPGTARTTLLALNQICRFAVRRGWLADNPVSKLEPAENPAAPAAKFRSSKATTSPAYSTTPAATDSCSSCSLTPACGSAKRSDSPGPTSTTTPG